MSMILSTTIDALFGRKRRLSGIIDLVDKPLDGGTGLQAVPFGAPLQFDGDVDETRVQNVEDDGSGDSGGLGVGLGLSRSAGPRGVGRISMAPVSSGPGDSAASHGAHWQADAVEDLANAGANQMHMQFCMTQPLGGDSEAEGDSDGEADDTSIRSSERSVSPAVSGRRARSSNSESQLQPQAGLATMLDGDPSITDCNSDSSGCSSSTDSSGGNCADGAESGCRVIFALEADAPDTPRSLPGSAGNDGPGRVLEEYSSPSCSKGSATSDEEVHAAPAGGFSFSALAGSAAGLAASALRLVLGPGGSTSAVGAGSSWLDDSSLESGGGSGGSTSSEGGYASPLRGGSASPAVAGYTGGDVAASGADGSQGARRALFDAGLGGGVDAGTGGAGGEAHMMAPAIEGEEDGTIARSGPGVNHGCSSSSSVSGIAGLSPVGQPPQPQPQPQGRGRMTAYARGTGSGSGAAAGSGGRAVSARAARADVDSAGSASLPRFRRGSSAPASASVLYMVRSFVGGSESPDADDFHSESAGDGRSDADSDSPPGARTESLDAAAPAAQYDSAAVVGGAAESPQTEEGRTLLATPATIGPAHRALRLARGSTLLQSPPPQTLASARPSRVSFAVDFTSGSRGGAPNPHQARRARTAGETEAASYNGHCTSQRDAAECAGAVCALMAVEDEVLSGIAASMCGVTIEPELDADPGIVGDGQGAGSDYDRGGDNRSEQPVSPPSTLFDAAPVEGGSSPAAAAPAAGSPATASPPSQFATPMSAEQTARLRIKASLSSGRFRVRFRLPDGAIETHTGIDGQASLFALLEGLARKDAAMARAMRVQAGARNEGTAGAADRQSTGAVAGARPSVHSTAPSAARYSTVSAPTLNPAAWAVDEVDALVAGVASHGEHAWAAVLADASFRGRFHRSRSPACLQTHWTGMNAGRGRAYTQWRLNAARRQGLRRCVADAAAHGHWQPRAGSAQQDLWNTHAPAAASTGNPSLGVFYPPARGANATAQVRAAAPHARDGLYYSTGAAVAATAARAPGRTVTEAAPASATWPLSQAPLPQPLMALCADDPGAGAYATGNAPSHKRARTPTYATAAGGGVPRAHAAGAAGAGKTSVSGSKRAVSRSPPRLQQQRAKRGRVESPVVTARRCAADSDEGSAEWVEAPIHEECDYGRDYDGGDGGVEGEMELGEGSTVPAPAATTEQDEIHVSGGSDEEECSGDEQSPSPKTQGVGNASAPVPARPPPPAAPHTITVRVYVTPPPRLELSGEGASGDNGAAAGDGAVNDGDEVEGASSALIMTDLARAAPRVMEAQTLILEGLPLGSTVRDVCERLLEWALPCLPPVRSAHMYTRSSHATDAGTLGTGAGSDGNDGDDGDEDEEADVDWTPGKGTAEATLYASDVLTPVVTLAVPSMTAAGRATAGAVANVYAVGARATSESKAALQAKATAALCAAIATAGGEGGSACAGLPTSLSLLALLRAQHGSLCAVGPRGEPRPLELSVALLPAWACK